MTDRMLTFWTAIVGIGAVLIVFLVTLIVFQNAASPGELIPAIVGSVTGAIGTLAGLVAGHSAGAAGKERAENRAESNERDAVNGRALAHAIASDAPSEAKRAADGVEAFGGTGADPAALARRHAELARTMFPDLG